MQVLLAGQPDPSRRKIVTRIAVGAGAAAGAAAFARGTPAAAATTGTPDWINVTAYGADPTFTKDSTPAINSAIAAALQGTTPVRVVYFPAGTYKITSALQTSGLALSNLSLIGDGDQATQVRQITSQAGALLGSNVGFLDIQGISFQGVKDGTTGGAPGIYLETASGGTTVCCTFTDVSVDGFQADGISVSGPVLCSFRRVNSSENSGSGFTFAGQGTSLTMDSCYARANAGNGYQLTSLNYTSLNGCAADGNNQGYALTGCTAVALVGCGAEGSASAPCKNAFVLTGGTSNTLLSCYMNEIEGTGVSVSGGERGATLSAVSWHYKVSPTNFVSVASGCVATLLNCITDQTTGTALSLAANTTTILCDGGNELSVAGTAYVATTNVYGPLTLNSGASLVIPEGTNARMGTATLAGTTAVQVSTSAVTAKTRIFITTQTPHGTPGTPYVSAITAGSSFQIKSTSSTDTSVVAWVMVDHT